jgi:hypothetical protein
MRDRICIRHRIKELETQNQLLDKLATNLRMNGMQILRVASVRCLLNDGSHQPRTHPSLDCVAATERESKAVSARILQVRLAQKDQELQELHVCRQ